jgi:arylsulfatase A-like enzyme
VTADAENPPTRADYAAMLEAVDGGVGRILQTVARLGLTDNTIVIFTNDNGGEWLSNGGPLFNRKWTVWEGGIRVPAIVKWPGRIRAGSVSDQPAITFDWSASILAAAGTEVPTGYEGIQPSPDSRRARAEAGADVLLAIRAQLQPYAAGRSSGRLEARG